jgi:subtilisin family serine protease
VLYFSFAGNYGNLKSNTSETWEGNFSGQQGNTPAGTFIVHNFGNGITSNVITPSANPVRVNLFWSDPLGASTNDYDLYVFDSTDTMINASVVLQNGSKDPYEFVLVFPKLGDKIAIVKKGGEDRYLHVDVLGTGALAVGTSGSMRGHATVEGAFGVAATNVATAAGGRFTGGATNPVENFSSDGPRRIFYNPDGTPITPGNLLSTGGKVRDKPDITAADGVATTLPASSGLNPFFGTSAAAPHAAAIAALVKSLNPALTQDQVRTALTSTALDIEAPGVDLNAGAGIVDAFQALTLVSGRQPQ